MIYTNKITISIVSSIIVLFLQHICLTNAATLYNSSTFFTQINKINTSSAEKFSLFSLNGNLGVTIDYPSITPYSTTLYSIDGGLTFLRVQQRGIFLYKPVEYNINTPQQRTTTFVDVTAFSPLYLNGEFLKPNSCDNPFTQICFIDVCNPDPIPSRRNPGFVVAKTSLYTEQMFLFGGREYSEWYHVVYNDVWVSNSVCNWVQRANAPWSPRQNMAYTTIYNGTRIVIIGGSDATNTVVYNDVWISNVGVTQWTLIASNQNRFSKRYASTLLNINEVLYLIGGYHVPSTTFPQMWVSRNGAKSWMQVTHDMNFTAVTATSIANQIFVGTLNTELYTAFVPY